MKTYGQVLTECFGSIEDWEVKTPEQKEDMEHAAQAIISEFLARSENPFAWCILATNTTNCRIWFSCYKAARKWADANYLAEQLTPLFTAPQPLPSNGDAEFLAKRLARVATIAGVTMPDGMAQGQIADCAGTILGQIAAKLEGASPQPPPSVEAVSNLIAPESIVFSDEEWALRCSLRDDVVALLKGGDQVNLGPKDF